ncbi:hypothetical protein BRCON_0936 [Candidatus Sumerlaea chitinivorans]|uniref:Uncharacterized protein n=1 Tax=Sumerlaea chitinivorans TaxID=2250252 RepID=A0A2Z4Y5C5_SUMC1|nr:hypothetical protein BRCON_0936 [Candidatus Sumerlaea chitinivorans]
MILSSIDGCSNSPRQANSNIASQTFSQGRALWEKTPNES